MKPGTFVFYRDTPLFALVVGKNQYVCEFLFFNLKRRDHFVRENHINCYKHYTAIV